MKATHTPLLLVLLAPLYICAGATQSAGASAGAVRRRVAIVGAGPAGSAAAYFLRQELLARGENPSAPTDIHVFERDGRVGGRAKSGKVEYGSQTLHFELGASMFIGKNKHLFDLSRKFNLTLCSHPCTFAHSNEYEMAYNGVSELGSYGIWDPSSSNQGGEWVVKMGNSFWMDAIKMLWRYRGTSALNHVRKRTAQAVDEFMQSYDSFATHAGDSGSSNNSKSKVFETWDAYLHDKPFMQMSLYYHAAEYYLSSGERVSRRFLNEVVSLATRVNYMQDIDRVNVLGAHISMAAESSEAYSVAGGNWQIFERMLQESNATLHLSSAVRSIQHGKDGYVVSAGTDDKALAEEFDIVIIAAPLPLSGIDVPGKHESAAAAVEYVHMYVTFAIGILNPSFFPAGDIPQLVVTPYHTTQPFNCLSILACLPSGGNATAHQPPREQQRQQRCQDGPVLVKIFSHAPPALGQIFSSVEWQHEQEWHSYPKLIPRNSRYTHSDDDGDDSPKTGHHKPYRPPRPAIPPIVLDRRADPGTPGVAGRGIYYVNGMETLFSTMESQTVAARHVVQLILE
ncbi:FAD/NAD(P)-binding domain-containing protein [Martensiomyces pterosporus]|nr:FAD/NAD(P)-binding domain-containing protein [Martensiomyces pterosporus]